MSTPDITVSETVSPAVEVVLPRSTTVFAVTIFISAFLLFQVQLIIAKQLLPWFGGTPAVWNTCLVFFQVLLLGGYAYSHLITERLSAGAQIRTHVALLMVSAAGLTISALTWRSPIYPGLNWRPESAASPVWHIVTLLSVSVGLPFFLLSTTGPLLQHWVARTHPEASPYQLYAMSNLGSLLGLLTYPLLFEPTLTLRNQGRIWTLAYFALICVCTRSALRFVRASNRVDHPTTGAVREEVADKAPSRTQRLLWFGLAACGCTMLLAITNLMCQEIAAVPFLWVLPLSIYLVSFVLCFHERRFYWRGAFTLLFVVMAVWGALVFLSGLRASLFIQFNSYALLLFACCMMYHGELARLKPPPRYLTSFYLHIACGGAFGSAFVGLLAPLIFSTVWEFQLGLWISGLLLAVVLAGDRRSWLYEHPRWLAPAVMLGTVAAADVIGMPQNLHVKPLYFHLLTALLAAVTLGMAAAWRLTVARRRWPVQAVALCAWCLFGLGFSYTGYARWKESVYMARNFYGVLQAVFRDSSYNRRQLVLLHGRTKHGTQFVEPALRHVPTGYYAQSSGIGLLLSHHPRRRAATPEERGWRLGVIGLGTGTLAAYAKAGDYIRYYEINPEVARIAFGKDALFTYLNDTPARKDIVLGDARISLERELASGNPQRFDVLVIDAFNSDSIPVHLLTREAIGIYLRHLRDSHSVLAFHISNRALDLRPVLVGLAREYHLSLLRMHSDDPQADAGAISDWVLMTPDPAGPEVAEIQQAGKHIQLLSPAPQWTDDYSNLLQVLR